MAAMVGIGQPLGVEIRGVIHTWYVSDLNLTIVDVVARVPVLGAECWSPPFGQLRSVRLYGRVIVTMQDLRTAYFEPDFLK